MINLDEHKIYVESHKMDMVPYSVAMQAIQQAALGNSEEKLDEALGLIKKSLYNIDLDTDD